MTKIASLPRNLTPHLDPDQPQATAGAQVGYVVGFDGEGRPWVDFPANPSGPLAARLALSDIATAEILRDPIGCEVLLVFENNDLAKPIIAGRVRDRLPANGIEIHVRGQRFTVETDEDIELRCGDARVRMSRDGKVVVLGNDVVSRARGRNKIKGGTVNIN